MIKNKLLFKIFAIASIVILFLYCFAKVIVFLALYHDFPDMFFNFTYVEIITVPVLIMFIINRNKKAFAGDTGGKRRYSLWIALIAVSAGLLLQFQRTYCSVVDVLRWFIDTPLVYMFLPGSLFSNRSIFNSESYGSYNGEVVKLISELSSLFLLASFVLFVLSFILEAKSLRKHCLVTAIIYAVLSMLYNVLAIDDIFVLLTASLFCFCYFFFIYYGLYRKKTIMVCDDLGSAGNI